MEDVEDVKDEAGTAPLPPTSPTPGVEDSSQGTDADAEEPNGHLGPEDQPHPAKRARKHSDADAASVISVRDFYCMAHFVSFCRFERTDQTRLLCSKESNTTSRLRSCANHERHSRSPSTKSHPDTHPTPNIKLSRYYFTFTSSTQILRVYPHEPEEVEGRATVLVSC